MKASRTGNFRSTAGKIMMGLVLVAMIGSIAVAPAIGKDNHRRQGKHDNGRYDHRGPVYYDHGRYHDGYRGRAYYPPPPVVYAPPPPPGIEIFFPPIFIHP